MPKNSSIYGMTFLSLFCFAAVTSTRRQRRQTTFYVSKFVSCIQSMNDQDDALKYVKEKKCLNQPGTWILQCRLNRPHRNCYYNICCRWTGLTLTDITGLTLTSGRDYVYKCDKIPSISSAYHISCCDFTCS